MREPPRREAEPLGPWLSLSLTLMYTAFWLATRWPSIRHNTLFFDDYGVPSNPAGFYIGSYRPLVWVEYALWELIVPNHFWTILPKLTASLYLGLFGASVAALLIRWRVPLAIAPTVPLIVLANPVLNDAGLWTSLHALPLGLFFITAAMLVWEKRSKSGWIAGALLMLAGTMIYQVFISLAFVWLAAELVIKRINALPHRFVDTARKLAVIAAVAVIQILHMELVRRLLFHTDARGLVAPRSWRTFAADKLHGMFNLSVNGTMPVIAWYAGAAKAFSAWMLVPLVIAAVTAALALFRRRTAAEILLAGVFPLVVFFLPAIPLLIISQSAYAWRVSSPTSVALAVSLVPLLLYLGGRRKPLWIVPAALAVILMVPVSHYEAKMRVVSQEREAGLMREIFTHWELRHVPRRAITIVYGPPRRPAEDVRLIGSHDLTWGYDRRSPGMFSSFETAWFATQFITRFHGLRFVDCSLSGSPAICMQARSLCDRNCSEAAALTPRVMYLDGRGTTLVCGGTAPPGIRTRCGTDQSAAASIMPRRNAAYGSGVSATLR